MSKAVIRRGVSLCVLLVNAALLLCAQKLSDAELFSKAQTAYQSGEFSDSAMYLFAYMDRRPPVLQNNPQHAAEVNAAWKYSTVQAAAALHKKCEPAQQAGNIKATTQGLSLSPPPLSPPAEQASATYPLVCRGGGPRRFSWEPYGFAWRAP